MKENSEKKEKKENLGVRFRLWWIDYFHVLKSCLRGISNDNITILASGLVYSTLIALVPCITFLFVFLSTFGVLQTFLTLLTDFISEVFGETNANDLISIISGYSNNARSLGVFGLISFIITGMLLVNKIYMVINQIFKTKPEQGIVKRFVTFFIFLVVFTFLIAMSFALSTTINQRLAASVGIMYKSVGIWKRLVSMFLLWLAFFLMLIAVPNAKIRAGSACVGATTGLVAVVISSMIFNASVRSIVSYSVIYGSVASIFFVLLYLYIIWYIVITISEITYVHQFRPDKSTLLGRPQTPMRILSEAVTVLLIIASKYSKGEGTSSVRELTRKLAIPSSRLTRYLRDMESSGLILSTNNRSSSYVPARPLSQITIKRVIEVFFGADEISSNEITTMGEAISMEFYSAGENGMVDLTIEEILERL